MFNRVFCCCCNHQWNPHPPLDEILSLWPFLFQARNSDNNGHFTKGNGLFL